MRRTHNSSVLIVDELDESREVLRTALERRGLRVLEATHCADGLLMSRLHQHDLVVLDLDVGHGGIEAAEEFADAIGNDGQLLILGSSRWAATLDGEFIAKPYHYKPLILRIEELLGL